MTDDLSTRLLAAIEKAAQEALDDAVSLWVAKSLCGPSRGWYEAECDCGWTTSGLQPVVWAAAENHVEENHPPLIASFCQAYREIVELHRPVSFTDLELGIADATVCHTCHGALVEPEDWDDSTEWAYPVVQVPYPCATVTALARGYNLKEEG